RYEPSIHIEEHGLTQAGAGGDDGGVAVGMRHSALQHRQLVWFEHCDAVCHRFKIVQHVRSSKSKALLDGRAFDKPRHVGESCDLIGDRTGDAETRRIDMLWLNTARFEKRIDARLTAGIIERREFSDIDRRWTIRPGRKKPKQGLGSTDV